MTEMERKTKTEIGLEEYLANQFPSLPISTNRGKRKISVFEEKKELGVKEESVCREGC